MSFAVIDEYREVTVPPIAEPAEATIHYFYDDSSSKDRLDHSYAAHRLAQLSLDHVLKGLGIRYGTYVKVQQIHDGRKHQTWMGNAVLDCQVACYHRDQPLVLGEKPDFDHMLDRGGLESWWTSPVEAVAVYSYADSGQVGVCWRTTSQNSYRMVYLPKGGELAPVPGTVMQALVDGQH